MMTHERITLVHFAADWWEHVCPTVRVLAPAQQAGLNVIHGNEWDGGKIRIFPDRVAQGDIVVIQRDFPRHAEGYEQIISQARTLGKPVVYELDDLLTELPDSHPDAEFYKIARAATLQAAAEADVVTTTTTPLADYLKSFNPNVQLLPNFLVDSLWRFAKPTLPASADQKRPVTIGYLGSHGHKFDLEMIVPALTHLARRYGDRIIFKFWGIAPPQPLAEIAKVELFQPGLVDYAQFANYFSQQECDIFVAPLQNSLFNRCKSSLKFLEYSALAMPSVCSRIDPYAVIVEHTKNGFLASTGEDWEEYLSCLVESPSLRREIGLAAQQTVRENWLLSNHAMEWDRVYRVALDIATNPLLSPVVKVAREMNRWHGELVGRLAEQKQASQLFQKQLVEKDEQLKTLSNQLGEKDEQLKTLSNQLGEKDEQLKTLSNQLGEKEQKIQGLESRLTEQTLAAQALSERVEQSEHTTLALRTELAKIQSSIGWEWLQVAWRTRMRLAPRGGYRERMLSLVVRGARVWRREGIVSLAKKATRKGSNKFLRRGLPQVQAIQQPLITFKAEPGIQCPQPAVSVFIPKEDDASSQLVELAKGWLARQTWQLVEAIIWDRGLGIAWRMNDSEIHWEARDIESLCSQAQGRYVCIASLDLLSQSETYLEANLIALESESLAFTVNVNGKSDWAIKQIQSNQLPSSRLITRKDCLRNDGSVDLSAWLAQQQTPVVIGKIITHTVSQTDQEELLVFESKATNAEILVSGQHILARLNTQGAWNTTLVLHPVDTVLPHETESSNLPTVLIVMPFLAVGGAERVHLDVLRRLKDQIRFVIITLEPYDASLGTMTDNFREVTPYIYTVPDYLATPLNFSGMTYLIERFQPRTLYIANGTTWIYDALCALKSFFPYLRMVNQVYDHQVGWINRYEPALAACLDAHIGVNRKICQAYIAQGAKPQSVYQIEHGVDPEEFDPARVRAEQRNTLKASLGLMPDQKVVTFIGRLHPQKRPMDFVELARRFQSDPTMVFLMVGDGPLAKVVETETARIDLKNLRRRAFYRPSREIFAVSDVVVLPSEYEGMPLVILEAQVMGKPVVVTDVGNTREILDLTRAGVVVPTPGDITGLANGIKKALNNLPDPEQLRRTVINRYGIKHIAEEYRHALLGE